MTLRSGVRPNRPLLSGLLGTLRIPAPYAHEPGRSMPAKGHKNESDDSASQPAYDGWAWVSPAAEREFKDLSPRARGALFVRIDRLLDGQTRSGAGDVKVVGNGIFELRARQGNNQYRVLYFVNDRVCVGLTCFYKNQKKLEKVDLDRAVARKKAYRAP